MSNCLALQRCQKKCFTRTGRNITLRNLKPRKIHLDQFAKTRHFFSPTIILYIRLDTDVELPGPPALPEKMLH